jgi:hypothetical protein
MECDYSQPNSTGRPGECEAAGGLPRLVPAAAVTRLPGRYGTPPVWMPAATKINASDPRIRSNVESGLILGLATEVDELAVYSYARATTQASVLRGGAMWT